MKKEVPATVVIRCAVSLMFFFLILITNSVRSQDISTVGEIYNFEVGDIFHFKTESTDHPFTLTSTEEVTNIIIINKYYNMPSDTLFYVRDIRYKMRESDTSGIFSPWSYQYYTDTVAYTNLDSLINNGIIDTVFTNSSYNGREINEAEYDNSWYYHSHKKFVNGCGFVFDDEYGYAMGDTYSNILVYYKKGNEEWGTQDPVSVKKISTDLFKTKIYPNPGNNQITIITENAPGTLTMFSLSGDIVLSRDLHTEKTNIDISKLPSGIYLITIQTRNNKVFKKLIID